MAQKRRPLGRIIHIVQKEAITKPQTPFKPGFAKVYLSDNTEIGTLRDPFGRTDEPYYPILLNNPLDHHLVGQEVYALINIKRRKTRKNKQYSGKKKSSNRKN